MNTISEDTFAVSQYTSYRLVKDEFQPGGVIVLVADGNIYKFYNSLTKEELGYFCLYKHTLRNFRKEIKKELKNIAFRQTLNR